MMFEKMFEKKSGVIVKSTKSGFTLNARVNSEDVQMIAMATGTAALINAVGPAAAGLAADGVRGCFRLANTGIKAVGKAAKAAVESHKKAAEKKNEENEEADQ